MKKGDSSLGEDYSMANYDRQSSRNNKKFIQEIIRICIKDVEFPRYGGIFRKSVLINAIGFISE